MMDESRMSGLLDAQAQPVLSFHRPGCSLTLLSPHLTGCFNNSDTDITSKRGDSTYCIERKASKFLAITADSELPWHQELHHAL